MKIGSWRRPNEEETGPLTGALKIITESHNGIIEEIVKCLTKNIKFEDNHSCETVSIDVKHNTDYTIKLNTLKSKPKRVYVDYTEHYSPWAICWKPVDKDELTFRIYWNDTPTSEYLVQLTIFGE